MQKVSPFLWFDDRAEEAVNLYVSLFPNSRIVNTARAGDRVMSMVFELEGVEYMALNGGPQFKFTEAVSLFVKCDTQAEVDHYWDALTANGGEESRCGWLKDPYGLSWQITPNNLLRYLSDPDPEKAGRVMQAMLAMNRMDVAGLDAAYAG